MIRNKVRCSNVYAKAIFADPVRRCERTLPGIRTLVLSRRSLPPSLGQRTETPSGSLLVYPAMRDHYRTLTCRPKRRAGIVLRTSLGGLGGPGVGPDAPAAIGGLSVASLT
jgi:hypothetical protein